MAGDHAPPPQHHVKRDGSAYAVNSHYIARAGDAGIDIQCLQDGLPPFCLPLDTGRPHFDPVLALSPTRQNALAAANGSRILIFNVAKRRTRCILKGNGRIVTSVSFSERETDILATGAVDGSICVWSVKQPSRPLHHLNGLPGACHDIAIHSLYAGMLATSHQNRLAVWSLLDSRLIAANDLPSSELVCLVWRARESVMAVCSDDAGSVVEASFGHSGAPLKTRIDASRDNDSDDEFNAMPRTHDRTHNTSTSLSLNFDVKQTMALGAEGLVVLPFESDVLYFYSYDLHESAHTELWRLHIDSRIECFALRRLDSSIDVVVYTGRTCLSYIVPVPVLDAMRWSINNAWMLAKSQTTSKIRPAEGKMLPEKLHRRNAILKSRLKRVPNVPIVLDKAPRKRPATASQLEAARPILRSITSSLELASEQAHENETDSPMPFLSPSIPARKHGLITPASDDLSLLPRSSFESTTSITTHGHDSDSDDETFAGNMRHSSSFLPGGVNVPLPRTCGAAFAPNGHLLTFFPFLPRPSSVEIDKSGFEKHSRDDQFLEASSLFPRFASFGGSDVVSVLDSDQSGSLYDASLPKPSSFVTQTPLLEHRPSWPVKVSPTKSHIRPLPAASKVSITIRNFEALTPTRKSLVTTYNICAKDPASAASLSLSNADAATSTGMHEAAEAWHLLAIILEAPSMPCLATDDRIRGYSGLHLGHGTLQSKGMPFRSDLGDVRAKAAAILWSSHPLGKAWAIDSLFATLEQQSNVQLLAYMSALLVRALANQNGVLDRSQHRVTSSQTFPASNEAESAVFDVTMMAPRIPVLRADSSALTTSERPPVKRTTSQSSSRTTSQPPTPYLGSSASTPPLILPPMVRHISRTSHSGSNSPEHHRSSFSVAAKNYAASIAEKFSSYGSSPPARKTHVSGSTNELSTSLPNASAAGSWSKSVSFASTLGVGDPTNRSLSLAQEDDNYDSDRTIDDSLPQTPKHSNTSVSFKMKNENHFNRTSTEASTNTVLPEIFLAKSALWRRHHAEQLRSWGFTQEAAELEAVLGSTRQSAQSDTPPPAVVCQSTNVTARATCIICYCVIHTAEQLCPTCLHTAHPRCLDEFISAQGDVAYTCPSGCGCDCKNEWDVVQEHDLEAEVESLDE